MWQFLLAAAVAGSSFFAQRFCWNGDPEPTVKSEQQDNDVVEAEEELVPVDHEKSQVPPPLFGSPSLISSGLCQFSESLNCEVRSSRTGEESIFRFSSLGGEGGIGSSCGSKGSVKAAAEFPACKRNDGVKRRLGSKKYEKSSTGRRVGVVEEPRKKGRRYFLCLKRRRTSKNAIARCEPRSSTGSTLFGWGLSVGIMYMVSAGKAEINKLNTTVHETAKAVQELQNELHQRKSYRAAQNSNCKSKVDANPRNISSHMLQQQVISNSDAKQEDSNYPEDLGVQVTDDVDCVSCVLTEEPEPEALKMDQLEAELEFELQKIPWCVAEEASSYEGNFINLGEIELEHSLNIMNTELLDDSPHKLEGIYFDSHQSHGVIPSELDKRLCHLLIEQQESQILELEAKLESSQSKLYEKETDLQALKDCVRHLTELSLETTSDETEEAGTQAIGGDCNNCTNSSLSAELLGDGANNMVGKKSMVGKKRVMESQSCDCHLRENEVSINGWGCM
ncbi:uncharacterized protein LOC122062448 [Macadamia integrifolia]|uniref:uncharacterized protein LOC122062448 n=1 Tax=Macadamia integrifolia TaxID=60698 RepID=UPI001C4ECD17|nr:uncharacterized protein LOC122062448 [Macadamia integrifolia]